MKRFASAVAIIAGALVLLVAGAAFFFDANQFRPMLEAELTKALGREVKLGELLAERRGSGESSEGAAGRFLRQEETGLTPVN